MCFPTAFAQLVVFVLALVRFGLCPTAFAVWLTPRVATCECAASPCALASLLVDEAWFAKARHCGRAGQELWLMLMCLPEGQGGQQRRFAKADLR
jgi:hypothetical protein